VFEVWPENAEAVVLFVELFHQWEMAAGMSAIYVCLPAERITAVLRERYHRRADRERLLTQLLEMQPAARRILNAKADG